MSGRPPSPCTLIKGTVHKRVEQLVNHNPRARAQLVDALKDRTQDYIQILMDLAGVTQEEATHLRQAWYNPQGWWRAHQPIEPIVRQSLIKALELAAERDLPIESHWLCVGNQFQVIVTCNDSQVIRLILTPPPPDIPAQPIDRLPMWIIKQGTGVERAGDENLSEAVEHVEHVEGHSHMVTVQLKAIP
jgi:hypothetical protein